MNFGKFDIQLILIMSTTVIFMSIIFPSLGLAGDSTSASNVPEFNPDAAEFDVGGDYPSRVDSNSQTRTLSFTTETPSSGPLDYTTAGADRGSNIYDKLNGPSFQIAIEKIYNASGTLEDYDNETIISFTATHFNETSGTTQRSVDLAPRESQRVDWFGYDMSINYNRFIETSDGYETGVKVTFYELGYGCLDCGSEEGTGLFGIATIVEGIAWVGEVFFWFLGFLFEVSVNLIALLFETIRFMFSLLAWISSNYFGVANSLSGIGSLIALLPGIVMSLELAKLVFVGISLLPTT